VTVAVVDLGIGNLASLGSALRHIGVDHEIADGPEQVERASVVLLPGVGAFDVAVERMDALGLRDPLARRVREDAPILGICLGMQLLFEGSAEGRLPGLGLLSGACDRLGREPEVKVPHVGFDTVEAEPTSWLAEALGPEPDYYFTHSYAIRGAPADCSVARCSYDGGFIAAVERWPLVGVQFHPEKSQSSGLSLLVAYFERVRSVA
jgi:glutamine amidotransferase